jgi:hypothetical protein
VEASEEAGVNGEAECIRDALWRLLEEVEGGAVDPDEAAGRLAILDTLIDFEVNVGMSEGREAFGPCCEPGSRTPREEK